LRTLCGEEELACYFLCVLTHAGKISHQLMEEKALREFNKFDQTRRLEADQTPSDFDKFVEEMNKQAPPKPKTP